MNSLSQWAEVTRLAFPTSEANPFNDFLSLIDIEFLAACEFTNFRLFASDVGTRLPPAHGHVLGTGGTYFVRRVPYDAGGHRIAALREVWREPKPQFTVLKQQQFIEDSEGIIKVRDIHRVQSAMLEMKILRHSAIRNHPNIIELYQIRWDVQEDLQLVSPSLLMEYGDFGTLADFQDHKFLALTWDAKKDICLDIAHGLQFLHDCGVIHGDVKPENILICTHPERSYVAKLSDFGSSLIDVFDDSPKRKILGTPGWAAPENHLYHETLGLRKLDIYSYGLLIWGVMLNGVKPWGKIMQGTNGGVDIININEQMSGQVTLTPMQFDSLKARKGTDVFLDLARRTLKGCQPGDVNSDIVDRVLSQTLEQDPTLRASDFGNIISLFLSGELEISSHAQPDILAQPLRHGHFGINSTWFPWYPFTLNTCPAPFRRLICTEITRLIGKLNDWEPQKAQLKLALAICHIQQFAPEPNNLYAAELVYQSARAGNIRAQTMCKPCFGCLGLPYPADLETWLIDGVRRGSALARRGLAEINPAALRSVEEAITNRRDQLGNRWLRVTKTSEPDCSRLKDFIPQNIDDIFKLFANRPGVTPLHLAALTGHEGIIKHLLFQGSEVDSRNAFGETPLHYASISKAASAIKLLCDKGASVTAQSNLHATPIHYSVVAFAPTEAIKVLCDSRPDLNVASDDMESLSDEIFSDYYFRLAGTPINWATALENFDAVEVLLDFGSKAFSGEHQSSNQSPWQLAFANRSIEIIELMCSKAKDSEAPLPTFNQIVPHLGDKMTTPLRLMLHESISRGGFIRTVSDLLVKLDVEIDNIGIVCECLDTQMFPEDTVAIVDDILTKKNLHPGVAYGVYRFTHVNTDNVTIISISLESFLSLALMNSTIEMVRMLFRHIRNLTTTIAPCLPYFDGLKPETNIQRTYFELLCDNPRRSEHEMADLVDALLAHGADRNSRGSDPFFGNTCPLEYAAKSHRLAAVKVFLDHDIGDVSRAMIVTLADSNSMLSLPIVNMLLQRRPHVLVGMIPASLGQLYSLSVGFLSGADELNAMIVFMNILCSLNEVDRNDALTAQKMWRMWETVKTLPGGLDAVRDAVQWTDFTGSTLLHKAVINGNTALCEILVEMGSKVNAEIGFPDLGDMIPGIESLGSLLQADMSSEAALEAVLTTSTPVLPTNNEVLTSLSSMSDILDSLSLLEAPKRSGSTLQQDQAAAEAPTSICEPTLLINTQRRALSSSITGLSTTLESLRGPTPLDQAFQRDWYNIISSSGFFQKEMSKIHNLAGDHKHRRDFDKRTEEIKRFLWVKGGKRVEEIGA